MSLFGQSRDRVFDLRGIDNVDLLSALEFRNDEDEQSRAS